MAKPKKSKVLPTANQIRNAADKHVWGFEMDELFNKIRELAVDSFVAGASWYCGAIEPESDLCKCERNGRTVWRISSDSNTCHRCGFKYKD